MQGVAKQNPVSVMRIIKGCSGNIMRGLNGVIIVLAILVAISFFVYSNSIDKAKVALAESTLHDIQKNLKGYQRENGKYPSSINFSLNCMDERGHVVFDPHLCIQIKSHFSSVESYKSDSSGYIMTARAKDSNDTLVTLKPDKISIQGN
jgi:type II secretory pathway pseudopilin PulG